jgi:hypothetical protein
MAIVFERDFGKVWTDGTTPCIFCSMVRLPTLEEMKELAQKQLELVKELSGNFKNVFSILDLRYCPLDHGHIVSHYISTVMPQQFKAGIKHKAFVIPEKRKSREIFFKAFLTISNQDVSMHDTFEGALEKINTIRTQPNTKKTKSFFGSLLARL